MSAADDAQRVAWDQIMAKHLGPAEVDTPSLQFTGTSPEGGEILVTVWDDGGLMQRALDDAGITSAAEIALRHGGTWSAPVRLQQVKA